MSWGDAKPRLPGEVAPQSEKPTRMNAIEWVKNHPARSASLAGWFQQAAGILASFVSIPFVLNRLSATESGVWFAFQGFLATVALTDFGFSYVIARQVAHSLAQPGGQTVEAASDFIRTQPGWAGISEVYRAGQALFLRVNLAGLALLVLVYEAVLPFTKLAAARTWESTAAWYILGMAMLVTLQVRLNQAVLEGLGVMYVTKAISGLFQLVTGFSIVLVLLLKPGLVAISTAVLTFVVVQYFVFHRALRAQAQGRLHPRSTPVSPEIMRKLWRTSAPIGLVSSSAYLVTSIQVPLVGAILGAAAVAPYYLAQRIGQAFTQAAVQLLQPQLPLFTREYSQAERLAARSRMVRTIVLVTTAAIIGCSVYFLASPAVVTLWVGPDRYVSAAVLLLMALDYGMLCSTSVWGAFVLGSGRNPFVWSTMANGGLNLLLAAGFCMWLGVIGLPIASMISGLCTNYWFSPYHGIRLVRSLQPSTQ